MFRVRRTGGARETGEKESKMDRVRRQSRRSAAVVLVALGMFAVSCKSNGKSTTPDARICTADGCDDEFAATISVTSASVPAGTQIITVTADGVVSSCSFEFPPPTVPGDGGAGSPCSSGLMASVQSAANCTTSEADGALTERCVSIPGEFKELIQVFGTPVSVRVQQSVAGGAVILDESVMPTYQVFQPNGPGCDPTCHQAGLAWTI